VHSAGEMAEEGEGPRWRPRRRFGGGALHQSRLEMMRELRFNEPPLSTLPIVRESWRETRGRGGGRVRYYLLSFFCFS